MDGYIIFYIFILAQKFCLITFVWRTTFLTYGTPFSTEILDCLLYFYAIEGLYFWLEAAIEGLELTLFSSAHTLTVDFLVVALLFGYVYFYGLLNVINFFLGVIDVTFLSSEKIPGEIMSNLFCSLFWMNFNFGFLSELAKLKTEPPEGLKWVTDVVSLCVIVVYGTFLF